MRKPPVNISTVGEGRKKPPVLQLGDHLDQHRHASSGAQGTVPSGTAATLTNGFRYVSIAPVLLPAGNYTIGAFYVAGGNFDPVAVLAATVTTASGVTYNGGRSEFGNAFPLADAFASGNNSYFGPNFQFTAPPTNGVPDASSTWTLLLFGLTATFGLKFFVRRAA